MDSDPIDEIGKMKCHCSQFADEVSWLLEGPVPLVATIALRGSPSRQTMPLDEFLTTAEGGSNRRSQETTEGADRGSDPRQSPGPTGADRCLGQAAYTARLQARNSLLSQSEFLERIRWAGSVPTKTIYGGNSAKKSGLTSARAGSGRGARFSAHVGSIWTVTLDIYIESTCGDTTRYTIEDYTRMRVPYVNPEGFRFTIYRKGFFSELGKHLGMQDIEVGDPDFDEAFIIKGNDESKVVRLFSETRIRQMIQAQPKFRLDVKDSEGWFGPTFPEDMDELRFQVVGVIKDVHRLKSLFDLFAAVLDQLCRIGSASEQEPGVTL